MRVFEKFVSRLNIWGPGIFVIYEHSLLLYELRQGLEEESEVYDEDGVGDGSDRKRLRLLVDGEDHVEETCEDEKVGELHGES